MSLFVSPEGHLKDFDEYTREELEIKRDELQERLDQLVTYTPTQAEERDFLINSLISIEGYMY